MTDSAEDINLPVSCSSNGSCIQSMEAARRRTLGCTTVSLMCVQQLCSRMNRGKVCILYIDMWRASFAFQRHFCFNRVMSLWKYRNTPYYCYYYCYYTFWLKQSLESLKIQKNPRSSWKSRVPEDRDRHSFWLKRSLDCLKTQSHARTKTECGWPVR